MRDFEVRVQYDDINRQLNKNYASWQIVLHPDSEKPVSEEEYTEIIQILNWAKNDIQGRLSNLKRELVNYHGHKARGLNVSQG